MWLSSKACSRPNDSAVQKSDGIRTASHFYRHMLTLQSEDAGASGSLVSSFAFLGDALATTLLDLALASEAQVACLQRDQITSAAASPEASLGMSHAGRTTSRILLQLRFQSSLASAADGCHLLPTSSMIAADPSHRAASCNLQARFQLDARVKTSNAMAKLLNLFREMSNFSKLRRLGKPLQARHSFFHSWANYAKP